MPTKSTDDRGIETRTSLDLPPANEQQLLAYWDFLDKRLPRLRARRAAGRQLTGAQA